MVEVLLISPPFRGLLREPVGLYYLAGVLKSHQISVDIVDFNIELPTRSGFHKYIKKIAPKIVGVTAYTFNFSVADKIIKEIKGIDSSIITVMGGVHASALPEKILKNNLDLDFIVVGEGEFTFLELCRKILDGETVENVRGLALRSGGRVVVNSPRELVGDLDDLPIPDRGLLPFRKYPVASVQTSRGCPYNCIFCNINRFYGKKIRLRDPKKVVDECAIIVEKYKRDKIFFFGDAFTFRADWVVEFCDEILRRGLKFIWGCETRVNNVSLPLLRKMSRAGCAEIQYGIDYGDEAILRKLGKDISIESIINAVDWAKKARLSVGAFFIFNVPGEDRSTIEKTFQLIKRIQPVPIEINLLTPYPGTAIWDNPEKFDMRITEKNFDYYTTKKYVMENINFKKNDFIPEFKSLLKRLNLVPTPGYYPEIYDFLKKDIKLTVWREEYPLISKLLRIFRN